jgi:hypothetical protein
MLYPIELWARKLPEITVFNNTEIPRIFQEHFRPFPFLYDALLKPDSQSVLQIRESGPFKRTNGREKGGER